MSNTIPKIILALFFAFLLCGYFIYSGSDLTGSNRVSEGTAPKNAKAGESGSVSKPDEAIATSRPQDPTPKDSTPSSNAMGGIPAKIDYEPRAYVDSSGYQWVLSCVKPWPGDSSLQEIASRFKDAVPRTIERLGDFLSQKNIPGDEAASALYTRASFHNYQGDPEAAYEDLSRARAWMERSPRHAKKFLYTLIFFQGVSALRLGENENCIMCRGESSCIIPIVPAAMHKYPAGSRRAITHFTEYLEQFPDDLHVKWLLNIAHMTLGEYPEGVSEKHLVNIDHFINSEFNIGQFRDIGHTVGLNRFNQAGGAIMDDFDNDGYLDVVVSTFDPAGIMGYFINTKDGKFVERTEQAGCSDQLGGLNCVQTDYNNDGFKDVFIVRGAWLPGVMAMRPSLLRNNGDRTFTDVTAEAGLTAALNSITSSWADFNNDGWLDLLVCGEKQANKLYHNNKDGTFEDVAAKAGLVGGGNGEFESKGSTWLDYDNDGFQDVYINHLSSFGGQLYHNNKDGTFTRVSTEMGIDGPIDGFSCWSWDYDNDGFLDIFATCYDRTVDACVEGLMGVPHKRHNNALYHNKGGKGFENVVKQTGLDVVIETMGSNFGDFDNDGFLDMYLGTGDPHLGTLVPNRMFRNVGGRRFSDITVSSRTGNLQKGHGVSCADWDADGNVDIFIEMGGAVNGDRYHNILFQNPGHDNNWVNLKLVGEKTNKLAIGARIKVVTTGENPQTIYRQISSGSSFGANPMEQSIGLGAATGIESIEIYWPVSQTTQTFRDVPTKSFLQISEFADKFEVLDKKPITHSALQGG